MTPTGTDQRGPRKFFFSSVTIVVIGDGFHSASAVRISSRIFAARS